jgi:septum site-determining protein MinC
MKRAATKADAVATLEQPIPPRPPVAIKGGPAGLKVIVRAAEPDAIETSLREQLLRDSMGFFKGASVVIELPGPPMDLNVAAKLAAALESAGMVLTAVVAAEQAGGAAEDRTAEPKREPRQPASPAGPGAIPAHAAMLVTGTVRGGQRLVHEGPVVVLGDVNPGAAVVAGGSVIVWGRLRGTVEAGLTGGESGGGAVVCALDLAPTQLRIGKALARAPEEPGRQPAPEVAKVEDGRIVVNEWR